MENNNLSENCEIVMEEENKFFDNNFWRVDTGKIKVDEVINIYDELI
jgi:hypothetical protein